MLQIIGIINEQKVISEIDPYLPFKVSFAAKGFGVEKYFFCEDDNGTTFLEFGVDKEHGTLQEITLITRVLIAKEGGYFSSTISTKTVAGFPVFNLDTLCLEPVDPCNCRLIIGEKSVSLELSVNVLSYYVKNDRFFFGVDEKNRVCTLTLNDLSKTELVVLHDLFRERIMNV